MPTRERNRNRKKECRTGFCFPDREDCDTIEEYIERVKMYWDDIDAYRDMANALYNDLMKGKTFVQDMDEGRAQRET